MSAYDQLAVHQFVTDSCLNPVIFLNNAKSITYANRTWLELTALLSASVQVAQLNIPATSPWNWINDQKAFLRLIELAQARSSLLSSDGYVFDLHNASGFSNPATVKINAFGENCVAMFHEIFTQFGCSNSAGPWQSSTAAMGIVEVLSQHETCLRYANAATVRFVGKVSMDEVVNKTVMRELHWPQADFDSFWWPMFAATIESKKIIRTLHQESITACSTAENDPPVQKHIKAAVCYVGRSPTSGNPMIAYSIEDFTEGIRTEEENRRAKRLSDAKGFPYFAYFGSDLFMASVSHELRTPLSSILGLARLLADMPELTTEMRDYVETLLLCSTSVTTLVDDLLEFSQIENNTFRLSVESFHVLDVVEQAIEIVSLAANRKPSVALCFDFQLPSDVLPCQLVLVTDMSRVRQVLVNLLMNAIKFTQFGHVYLLISISESAIHFSVKDTGVGIAASNLQKLFQPFSQAEESIRKKYGGTGLGLSLCKMLVERMGGQIGFESEEGKGSTFYFRLPLPQHPPPDENLRNILIASAKSETALNRTTGGSHSRSNSVGTITFLASPPTPMYINRRRRSLTFENKIAAIVREGCSCDIEVTSLLRKLRIFALHPIVVDNVTELLSLQPKPNAVLVHTPHVEWETRKKLSDTPVILLARDRPLVLSPSERTMSSSTSSSLPATGVASVLSSSSVLLQQSKQQALPAGYDYPHYFVRKPIKITQLESVLQIALAPNISPLSRSQLKGLISNNNNNNTNSNNTRASSPSSSSSSSSGLCNRFARHHPMSILVAEDNEANQKVLMKMLERLGYNSVVTANNGQIALEKFSVCHFDVIFMDINMPVMDGVEATTKLRQQQQKPGATSEPDRPYIICITADVFPEDRARAIHAGMNAFLAKPFDVGSLTSVLSQAWGILYTETEATPNKAL